MGNTNLFGDAKISLNSGIHKDVLTVVMILVSVLLLISAIFLIHPQLAPQREKTYESLVDDLFDEVLQGVQDMRDLPSPEKIELNIVSIQWFRDRAKEDVKRESEEIRLEDIVHKTLFLIPQNYSVGEAQVEQASRIKAAVSGNRLYVVHEFFDPLNTDVARRTLAHEITHLLQSQFISPSLVTSDQRWAWIALVEGDADFTADTYISGSELLSLKAYEIESLDKIRGFHYQCGSGFISALFMKAGWNQVNYAYVNPPRSTEEILHPEIYLAGGSFKKVEALFPGSSEWKVMLTDTFGENFIRVMLENGLSREVAIEAAVGWGGDNLTLFSKDENYLVTWRINWDTIDDASEFIKGFKNLIVKMNGKEVGPELYNVQGNYLTFTKRDLLTEIASSSEKELIFSIQQLMKH